MKAGKICIVALVLLAAGYLGFSSFRKIREKKKVESTIQTLPAFSFERQLSGQFSKDDISSRADKVIINFFNPDCDHCQHMAGELTKNQEKFKDHQLLLVTTADSLSVDKFNKTYKLSAMPNLVLLRDTKYRFASTFGAHIIPSFFVYDEDRNLVHKITGETKIENLLK